MINNKTCVDTHKKKKYQIRVIEAIEPGAPVGRTVVVITGEPSDLLRCVKDSDSLSDPKFTYVMHETEDLYGYWNFFARYGWLLNGLQNLAKEAEANV